MTKQNFNFQTNGDSLQAAVSNASRKSLERIKALQEAGYDTSSFLAVCSVAHDKNGNMRQFFFDRVEEPCNMAPDMMVRAIMAQGTIPEHRLFRRWVAGQMFEMMSRRGGFVQALKDKGYEYAWKMVVEEFRVQARIADRDPEEFTMRNLWFNLELAEQMAYYDLQFTSSYVWNMKRHKCKGKPYIHVSGKDVFVDDIEASILNPLRNARIHITRAETPGALYKAVSEYNKLRVRLPHLVAKLFSGFIQAYEGAGAYYTIENLIRFHGVTVNGADDSLKAIADAAREYAASGEGYKMMGMLKAALRYNNINPQEKMREWRK